MLALLRAQWAQVATVFALATLAVAAAVAAPVYVDMAGRAVAADDVTAASLSQRTISASDFVPVKAITGDDTEAQLLDLARRRDFEHVAPTVLTTPGFATVLGVGFPAYVTATADITVDQNGTLDFRENLCDHVVIVTGRCVGAPGEVIVSAGRSLAPNATAYVTNARFVSGGRGLPGFWIPVGETCRLAVVGVYRPADATDPYWGHANFSTPGREPVYTDRRTVATCDHEAENQDVVAYPLAGAFDVDHIAATRSDVRATMERARGRVNASSDIENLLKGIERDRHTVGLVPASAAVPLLALCWFVLFLAIAYTAQARRHELGIVKLRGVSTRDQWSLAAAESLTPVLAGAVAGYLLGHLGVWLYGRAVFGPHASVVLTTRPWPYAAVALAGAVLAAIVALRRDLAATATDLLRRVPARGARWGDLALGGVVAAAAVVALVQLRSATGDPTGLSLLAPALSLMALGLLGGAALDPVAARVGARAVHRGRVGLALGALHLGRRHTSSRLLAVVLVATALLTFAATAAAVAAQARRDQVEQAIGADAVLRVSEVRPAALLQTVRTVDPDGAYAMAVVAVDPGPAGKRVLAVDATRLSTASVWPRTAGLSAAAAARALRPDLGEPALVKGLTVTADTTVLTIRSAGTSLHLQATVAPLDGGPTRTYDLGPLRPGPATYTADVGCAAGCRLVGLTISPSGAVSAEFRVTLTSPAFAAWKNRDPSVLTSRDTPGGLELSASSGLFDAAGLRVVPPDAPVPLPVLDVADPTLPVLELASGDHLAVVAAGHPATLPRIGNAGVLADLEYLTRFGELRTASREGEIWLGPAAPSDVVDRFRAAGLTILGENRLDDELAAAARRPSAAGVRFLLVVAVLGLGLGAAGVIVAAGVERRSRADELRALRAQGLTRRHTRGAALVGYVWVVGVAAALGWAAAAVVWALTGDRLPLVDGTPPGPLPVLPGLAAAGAWTAGAAALLLLAAALTVALTRATSASTSDRSLR